MPKKHTLRLEVNNMMRWIRGSLFFLCCSIAIFAQEKKSPATITEGADYFEVKWLPFAGRCQDVLEYDIDGNGFLDIIITSINTKNDDREKMLFIYFQNGKNGFSKGTDQRIVLPSKATALVFGNFLGTKATTLAFMAEDGLYYYQLNGGRLNNEPFKLLHTETFLDMPSKDDFSIWLYPTDLDGNGLDDIIIPTSAGYKVYMQTTPGKFGKVSYIKLPLTMYAFKVYTEAAFIDIEKGLGRLVVADINGDGKKDLVTIQKDTLLYFYQDKDGFFNAPPQRVTLGALYEAPKTNQANMWFVSFHDINSDGKADLVLSRVGGEIGLMASLKTKVMIFLGDGSGRFRNPDSILDMDGVSIEPEIIDINNDGYKDLVVSSLRTDILNEAVKIILLRTLDITYYVYLFDKKINNFPATGPAHHEDVRIRIKDLETSGMAVVPFIYFRGDFNGDGLRDITVLDENKTLKVNVNKHIKDELRYTVDSYLKVELSKKPKGLHMVDINGDQKTDIVLFNTGNPMGIILSK